MSTKTLKPTVVKWHEPGKLDRSDTRTLLIEYYPSYQRDYTAIAAAVINRGALLVNESWIHFDHLLRFAILDLGEIEDNG